jgi:hypothetical protein
MSSRFLITAALIALPLADGFAQQATSADLLRGDPSQLQAVNVTVTRVQYRGRDAFKVVPRAEGTNAYHTIAIVDQQMGDGTIEADIAGVPAAGADTSARGFVGIAFHVDSAGGRYGAFYLRPTNGRAQDQLRRNHATQYVSEPEYPWHRLRREQPGVYESYVDLESGAWTSVRIELRDGKALLYVNGSKQPVLIVNDMKNAPASGRVALWIGAGTEAHFSRLRVTPAK